MAPRRSPLSSLFAPPYIPNDPQSAQDVADWQSGRAGTWSNSDINRYQVPTPQAGVSAGFPASTSVDPALLQAAAQNQSYTPGPNVTVQPPGGPAPGVVTPAAQPEVQQMPSRDDLAWMLSLRPDLITNDTSQGVAGAGGGVGGAD